MEGSGGRRRYPPCEEREQKPEIAPGKKVRILDTRRFDQAIEDYCEKHLDSTRSEWTLSLPHLISQGDELSGGDVDARTACMKEFRESIQFTSFEDIQQLFEMDPTFGGRFHLSDETPSDHREVAPKPVLKMNTAAGLVGDTATSSPRNSTGKMFGKDTKRSTKDTSARGAAVPAPAPTAHVSNCGAKDEEDSHEEQLYYLDSPD
eukprot:GDKH01012199.1.p1 GENE.GDKH01012199.1~~GDKH01012199.1.p1  ORF type:complete len:205 (-),score=8.76 GDKH01012199.1:236-850(-)